MEVCAKNSRFCDAVTAVFVSIPQNLLTSRRKTKSSPSLPVNQRRMNLLLRHHTSRRFERLQSSRAPSVRVEAKEPPEVTLQNAQQSGRRERRTSRHFSHMHDSTSPYSQGASVNGFCSTDMKQVLSPSFRLRLSCAGESLAVFPPTTVHGPKRSMPQPDKLDEGNGPTNSRPSSRRLLKCRSRSCGGQSYQGDAIMRQCTVWRPRQRRPELTGMAAAVRAQSSMAATCFWLYKSHADSRHYLFFSIQPPTAFKSLSFISPSLLFPPSLLIVPGELISAGPFRHCTSFLPLPHSLNI